MPKLEFDVPDELWDKFSTNASRQFPKHENPASAFLSEVIKAGADSAVTTYFMTGVPAEHASAIQVLLQQNSFTWDQFHAYLLMAAVKPGLFRVIRFHDVEDGGVFIATGVSKAAFEAIEKVSGHSAEIALATMFAAAASGTLTISPETVYIDPS